MLELSDEDEIALASPCNYIYLNTVATFDGRFWTEG